MNDFFDLNCFLLDPKLPKEASKDHVRMWLEYKAGGGVDDPDSSDEARNFYKTIWKGFLEKSGLSLRPEANSFSENPDQYVQGDWMCSVWWTLKHALQEAYGENENGDEWWQKPDIEDSFDDYDATEDTFAGILKHFDEFSEVFEDKTVQEFIRAAYTSANLIIVPDGFNTARSNRGTEDYWDLTLKKYYQQDKKSLYYTDRNTHKQYEVAAPFRKLLKKNQEQGDLLCLSPWIDEQGNPILLPDSPKENKANWRSAMAEMTSRIKCRCELMAQYIAQLQNE